MTSALEAFASFDGKSVEPFRRVSASLPKTSASIVSMLELASESSAHAVQIGATWVAKDLLEAKVAAPPGLVKRVTALLAQVEAPDALLHLLQALELGETAAEDAGSLAEAAEPLTEHRNAFVRAWAFNALGLAALADRSLRPSVLARFEAMSQSEKASVKVRIRKARERLSKAADRG